jgi:hypothetical protein
MPPMNKILREALDPLFARLLAGAERCASET